MDARPPKRVMFITVIFLLILAVSVSGSLAWMLGVNANRESNVRSTGYGGGLVRLLAYDAKPDSHGNQIIDLDSFRVLDNGKDTLDDSGDYQRDSNGEYVLDKDGNRIHNTLFPNGIGFLEAKPL